VSTYAALIQYRELFGNLFRRDLQAKYRGSVLGVLWTVANPVLLMSVYLLVFSVVLNSRFAHVDHYPLFLLSGLAVWTFFAAALQSSTRSMLDNANLIRKTRFPRQLVPLSVVGAHLVSFGVMLVGLLILNFAVLPRVRATELLAIPLAACIVALVSGLALTVSSLNVLFRDIEFIVAALLLPWFFLTPVIYPLGGVPGVVQRHHTIVELLHWGNIVTPGLEAIRDPLFYGRLPDWRDALYLVVAALLSLALGAFVFNRVDDQIAIEV
jgi:homopolymeric O-antigen transport system permease protein